LDRWAGAAHGPASAGRPTRLTEPAMYRQTGEVFARASPGNVTLERA
jgi:hypothetical protein